MKSFNDDKIKEYSPLRQYIVALFAETYSVGHSKSYETLYPSKLVDGTVPNAVEAKSAIGSLPFH